MCVCIGLNICISVHIVKRNNATKCFLKWKQNIRSEKKVSPSFRFETKITKLKRSEKFETKRSEKMDLNFWSEQAKHKWNGSNFASFRLSARRAHLNPDWESNPGRLNVYKKRGEEKVSCLMWWGMSDLALFRSANHWLSDDRLSDERKGKLKKWTHERQRSRGKNWVGSG